MCISFTPSAVTVICGPGSGQPAVDGDDWTNPARPAVLAGRRQALSYMEGVIDRFAVVR
jgi:hypothetical protein